MPLTRRLLLTPLGVFMLCATLLSACGFQLRGSEQAAMPMDTLALTYPGGRFPLAEMLRDALVARNVMVPAETGDHLHLQLSTERLDRRALTLNNRGGAGQYELILQVDANVFLSGRLIAGPETLEVTGSFYEDTANISGSNNGVEQTLDDMRRELADQIVRRLRLLSL
jgi:LPS-assembly lipoprotein